jgi:hypothetical protein
MNLLKNNEEKKAQKSLFTFNLAGKAAANFI